MSDNDNNENRTIEIVDSFVARDDARTKGIESDPKGGKPLMLFVLKTQVGKNTGKEAIKKSTTIRHRGYTFQIDQVWEKEADGRWFIVHSHFKSPLEQLALLLSLIKKK